MAHVTTDTEFVVGSLVRLSTTVQQDGNLVDPATVEIILEEPDGTELSFTLLNDVNTSGTGQFYYDYDAQKPGVVEYRWKTGNPQGAKENYIVIAPSRVPNP